MDYFSCRLCHDDIISTHKFDRYNVNKIQCKKCNTEQEVSNECINCKIKFEFIIVIYVIYMKMKILKYTIVINVIYVEKGKRNYLNIVINVMVVLVLIYLIIIIV